MGTITKALELLDYFSSSRSELGLGDFVRLTQRDKATVHRHLTELEQNGFLEQDPQSRAYRLGPALLRLSAVREAAFPVRRLMRPIVTDLADRLGELAHASLLQNDTLSPVFHADPGRHGTQVHFDESERLPLHATSGGLAVLAFLPPEGQDRILSGPLTAATRSTQTDPQEIHAMIEKVHAQGFIQLTSSFDAEVGSLGAPLFGQAGQVIGALSVAVPIGRASDASWSRISIAVQQAARAATLSLGGLYPDFPISNGAGTPALRRNKR